MSTRRNFLAGMAGAVGAALLPGARAQAGVQVLTATDVHVKDYPTVEAVRWMGEQLERESGGRIRIRQYHSGQLGRESESIDMARFGAIDFTRVYAGALNNAFPLTEALCLPYLFDSVAHVRRVVDGAVGAAVLKGFEARGLVGLAIYDSGARCFYNTRHAIHMPADLHGLKFRVPASDIFIRMMRMLGANPTPLSFGQVFSGMETRLIDGAENNMRSFHSSRQFEAAHYWSQSEHSYAPDVLLMSRRTFDALAPRDRTLVIETAQQSVKVMRDLWDSSDAAARAAVVAAGVKINAVDMPAFRAVAQPLLDDYAQRPHLAPLLQRIRQLSGGVHG